MEQTASLLIVDDEAGNFDVIEILLFKEGYQLSYAADGFAALEMLENLKPDVILLDVMMPGLDGIEVCRQIKANPASQHIPVIMVTALNSKEDLAQCLDAGADDFVAKPINGLELRSRIRSMLRIKRQYDELTELVKSREASLQLREDMSNMVIHDLRNPLTNLVLATQILKLYGLTEKQRDKVEQIEYASQRLESLVDSLLMMAKLEAGKLLLNLTEIDFHELGKTTIADFQEIALQQKVELVARLPESSQLVWVDATLIRRVLDNLLSNALKFSPPDCEVTLEIDYPTANQVRIQVKDMGQGVPEEFRQRIFEKFEVGEALQRVNQVGLGLTFCKLAIEAHHGTIAVAARQPKGAIFTVEIETQL
jgi:two-component system, sensor histidine kinase and response regulator